MATWQELEQALALRINGERLAHTYRVLDTARRLAAQYGADPGQTEIAALMHDYAKALPAGGVSALAERYGLFGDPSERQSPCALLHAPVGAAMLREEGLISDEAVLAAIARHTVGAPGMTALDKVIWLADYIEPGRNFPGVEEMRRLAAEDLDRALLAGLEQTIRYVLERGHLLHLDTVRTRNWLVQTRGS